MENAEEILQYLEEFSKRKPKLIPQELNDYLTYVARTGDPVYQWSLVKSLFKEKLLNVITDFYETTPGLDIPPCPNVDPFNYDTLKNSLLERLDSFNAAPFTVQRICELLMYPRKQYSRIDKFMRAVEKNILVVSTREPGQQRHVEIENGESGEPMVNGSDNNSEYNVDVEMEDMSWKEKRDLNVSEPQPGSSDTQISVDNIEARLQAKQDASSDAQDKVTTQYESVTPPELNVTDETTDCAKTSTDTVEEREAKFEERDNVDVPSTSAVESKMETESPLPASTPLIIPEITVDDAEMTEQKLSKQSSLDSNDEIPETTPMTEVSLEQKAELDTQPQTLDDSSSDSTKDEINEPKLISEVSTSSEESSSSSDITDGNSNSPNTVSESSPPVQDETSLPETISEEDSSKDGKENEVKLETEDSKVEIKPDSETPKPVVQSDYSISDVNSELPQRQDVAESKDPEEITEEKANLSAEVKTEDGAGDAPAVES